MLLNKLIKKGSSLVGILNDKKEFLFHTALYTSSAITLKIVGFVLLLWMARNLPVEQFATFGLLIALQTGIVTFATTGLIEALIGLLSNYHAKKDKLFRLVNSAFCILSIFVFVALLLLKVSYNTSWPIFFSVAGSGFMLAYFSLQSQYFRLNELHSKSVILNVVPMLTGYIFSLILFSVRSNVDSYFYGSVVGIVVSTIAMFITGLRFWGIESSSTEVKKILLKLTPFIAITFFGWLNGYGSNYLVDLFSETKEVGAFAFILSISAIMQLFITGVNQVWSPKFYSLMNSGDHERAEFKNLTLYNYTGIGLGAICGFFLIVYPYLLKFGGGNLLFYKDLKVQVFLMLTSYIVLLPWYQYYNHLLVLGRGDRILKLTLYANVIGIAVWISFIITLGSIGIYIGYFCQMLVKSISIYVITREFVKSPMAYKGLLIGLFLSSIGLLVSQYLSLS